MRIIEILIIHLSKMKYTLTNTETPDFSLLVTEDQKQLLEKLCDVEMSSDGKKIYIINKQRFTMELQVKTDAQINREKEMWLNSIRIPYIIPNPYIR